MVVFLFSPIIGYPKGFEISWATPNWHIFLFTVRQLAGMSLGYVEWVLQSAADILQRQV